MPPASATTVNSNSAAVQAAAAKAEREEKLRGALKTFIIKERQRKREEFEAQVEEERLRKEREARQRQNDMTLEETRGQIVKLDQKLTDLRNQKQQLFLQLKKVLNEDENRKKQQKDNELFALQTMQAQQANVPLPQVFLPPIREQQHHQMPLLPKSGNQSMKRGRSPSPISNQGFYKSTNYAQSKHERRGVDYARVLWNKPPNQYQSPGTLFYQTTSNAPPPPQPTADGRGAAIIYPAYNLPLRQGYHLELQPTSTVPVPVSKPDTPTPKPTQVYHINLDQPPISQAANISTSTSITTTTKPQVTMEKITDRYHVEVKSEAPPGLPDNVVYTPLIQGMPLHPNVLQISASNGQNSKSPVSITQGYTAARPSTTTNDTTVTRQPSLSVVPAQSGQQQNQPTPPPSSQQQQPQAQQQQQQTQQQQSQQQQPTQPQTTQPQQQQNQQQQPMQYTRRIF